MYGLLNRPGEDLLKAFLDLLKSGLNAKRPLEGSRVRSFQDGGLEAALVGWLGK